MKDSTEIVTARFTLQVDAGLYLPEASIASQRAQVLAAAAAVAAPFGQLVLEGAGQAAIGLHDDLLPLASNLRVLLPRLRAGTAVTLGSYSQPGALRFSPDGATIRVADDEGEGDERAYPAAALTEALSACLARLLALLPQLSPQDPAWQAKLARIEPA